MHETICVAVIFYVCEGLLGASRTPRPTKVAVKHKFSQWVILSEVEPVGRHRRCRDLIGVLCRKVIHAYLQFMTKGQFIKRLSLLGASRVSLRLGLSAALTTHCVVIHYRLVRFATPRPTKVAVNDNKLRSLFSFYKYSVLL